MIRIVIGALSGVGGVLVGASLPLHSGVLAVAGCSVLGGTVLVHLVWNRQAAVMRRADELERDDRLAAEFTHNVLCTTGKWPHDGVCGVLDPDEEIKPGVTRRQRLYGCAAWGFGRVFPAPAPTRCEDR